MGRAVQVKKILIGGAALAAATIAVIYLRELIRLALWSLYIGLTLLLSWTAARLGPWLWLLLVVLVAGVVHCWRWKRRSARPNHLH